MRARVPPDNENRQTRPVLSAQVDRLEAWLGDPAPFRDRLAERFADYEALFALDPPYIVDGQAAPLSGWARKAMRPWLRSQWAT